MNRITLGVLLILVLASLATPPPAIAAHPTFLLPTPCPEAYQPCCTNFYGIRNEQILQRITGLQRGQTAAVLLPDYLGNGSQGDIGYYAHVLAKLVGPQGHVYTITPPELAGPAGSTTIRGRVVTGDYLDPNVTQLVLPFSQLPSLPRLDLVWAAPPATGPLSYFKPLQSSFLPVFLALRPHGRLIILDADRQLHCGRPTPDCPASGPILLQDQQHDTVLQQIQQAGFDLVLETRKLIDPSIAPPAFILGGGHGLADGTHWGFYPFLWVLQRRSY